MYVTYDSAVYFIESLGNSIFSEAWICRADYLPLPVQPEKVVERKLRYWLLWAHTGKKGLNQTYNRARLPESQKVAQVKQKWNSPSRSRIKLKVWPTPAFLLCHASLPMRYIVRVTTSTSKTAAETRLARSTNSKWDWRAKKNYSRSSHFSIKWTLAKSIVR